MVVYTVNIHKLAKQEMTRKEFLGFLVILVATVAGITGLLKELRSRAATLATGAEAELGALTGQATVAADATASNGSAVKFGAASGGSAIAISSSVLSAPTFPIRIDTDKRNFVDAANKPFYSVADTGWSAMNKLSRADFTAYAAKRREQGYNMLLLSVLRLETRSDAGNVRTDPQYATGKLPFTNMGDISTPLTTGTDTYWTHIAWCVDECKRLGLVAGLVPAWYGYEGGAWRSTVASSTTKAAAYGTFLAGLLGSRTNVWWLLGGDCEPSSALAATNAMASAIKAGVSSGNHQLMTYHTGRNLTPWSSFGTQPWYDMHAAYSGVASGSDTNAGIRVVDEYNRTTVKPVILVEDYYDKRGAFGASPDIGRTELRNQIWQAFTAGGFAAAHGNEYTWRFVSGWNGSSGWNAESANIDNKVFSRVLGTWPSKRFLADHNSPIITSGRGSSTATAYGLRSTDNTVGMVYIPANGRGIVINTALFAGAKSLAWVNPTSGVVTQFASAFTGSSYTVTSPSITGDSLLIIQST